MNQRIVRQITKHFYERLLQAELDELPETYNGSCKMSMGVDVSPELISRVTEAVIEMFASGAIVRLRNPSQSCSSMPYE